MRFTPRTSGVFLYPTRLSAIKALLSLALLVKVTAPPAPEVVHQGARQFLAPASSLAYFDFSDSSSYQLYHVKPFSAHSCTHSTEIEISGSYVLGRVVLCANHRSFQHDVTFFTTRDYPHLWWLEYSTKRLITPAYYRTLNDHSHNAPLFSWSGALLCLSNKPRDRILDSLNSWPHHLTTGDYVLLPPTDCHISRFVVLNETHEAPLCEINLPEPPGDKPIVYRKYCSKPTQSKWQLTNISFDLNTHLLTIVNYFKQLWRELISHLEAEFDDLLDWLFTKISKTISFCLTRIWSSIDEFNNGHYLLEYLLLFGFTSYRSSSGLAALTLCFVTVWFFGFVRNPVAQTTHE